MVIQCQKIYLFIEAKLTTYIRTPLEVSHTMLQAPAARITWLGATKASKAHKIPGQTQYVVHDPESLHTLHGYYHFCLLNPRPPGPSWLLIYLTIVASEPPILTKLGSTSPADTAEAGFHYGTQRLHCRDVKADGSRTGQPRCMGR